MSAPGEGPVRPSAVGQAASALMIDLRGAYEASLWNAERDVGYQFDVKCPHSILFS